jgi:hypothetical protein
MVSIGYYLVISQTEPSQQGTGRAAQGDPLVSINTTVTFRVLPDLDPDSSYLEQEGFEERLDQYQRDLFAFVGVRVEVRVHDTATGVVTNVTSPGLWGIEDDSGADYLRNIGTDELALIEDELAARGIDITGIEPVLE